MRLCREDIERRRDRIVEMTRAGRSIRDICAELSVSNRTVSRARRACGVAQTPAARLTVEQLERGLELLTEGAGYHEAATAVGCHDTTLARHFPGYALSTTEQVERMTLGQQMARLERSLR